MSNYRSLHRNLTPICRESCWCSWAVLNSSTFFLPIPKWHWLHIVLLVAAGLQSTVSKAFENFSEKHRRRGTHTTISSYEFGEQLMTWATKVMRKIHVIISPTSLLPKVLEVLIMIRVFKMFDSFGESIAFRTRQLAIHYSTSISILISVWVSSRGIQMTNPMLVVSTAAKYWRLTNNILYC